MKKKQQQQQKKNKKTKDKVVYFSILYYSTDGKNNSNSNKTQKNKRHWHLFTYLVKGVFYFCGDSWHASHVNALCIYSLSDAQLNTVRVFYSLSLFNLYYYDISFYQYINRPTTSSTTDATNLLNAQLLSGDR